MALGVFSSAQSTKGHADISFKIGGRLVTPALPVVDASPPTSQELEFDQVLTRYTAKAIPVESTEGIKTRERVLNQLGELSRIWIESVCRRLLLPNDMIAAAGGQLFTSGSYRLGIHEPGADIDLILVAPSMCTREDFFGSNTGYTNSAGEEVRDPESLAERIRNNPNVTNFNAVETAAVPILEFVFDGINIDLLFARLSSPTVPRDLDIDNDSVIGGVDAASATSLNGPRVTNMIAAAVSGTVQRYQTFLKVVRCVRKWAKARGLYSNKMGYWGGVNINIAVAFCIQLYPNSSPSSLLRKFFLVFKTWRWPNPIMLTKPHDAKLGLPVWTPQQALLGGIGIQRQVAPIITPAYPAMNSTLSVSRQTLQIFQEELNRGHAIIDKLWKDFKLKGMDMPGVTDGSCFESLFEPSDFFISYSHYLSVCIVGQTQDEVQAWAGFVESRLRKLVSDLLGKSLPLSKIQLWPKKFDACIADKFAVDNLTEEQRTHCLTYFIGFQIDTLRMKGTQLNVEQQLQKFKEYELNKFHHLVAGQDVLFKAYRVKELPRFVFDEVYSGGRAFAMKRRKKILSEDPKRLEAKRRAKMAELKAKMAAVQQKIQEKQHKSKEAEITKDREDSKTELEVADELKSEQNEATVKEDEADLLESALDNLQDTAPCGKTREEAELERQKLLSGELLVVGSYESDNEEIDDIGASDEGFKPSLHAKRSIAEIEADILQRAQFNLVSDESTILLDPCIMPHWKQPRQKTRVASTNSKLEVKLFTKFDVVELDSNGFVVDKGDDYFIPSKNWTGRKGGFEFKLGTRGLGYYRTGAKVVVPSNIAYK